MSRRPRPRRRCSAASTAACHGPSGSGSPNQTMLGPDQTAADGADRWVSSSVGFGVQQRSGVLGTARVATEFEKAAVQMVHGATAGALVQIVDVLRDDGDVGDLGMVRQAATARCPSFGSTRCTRWWRHRYQAHTRSGWSSHPRCWRAHRDRNVPTDRSCHRGRWARRSPRRCPHR